MAGQGQIMTKIMKEMMTMMTIIMMMMITMTVMKMAMMRINCWQPWPVIRVGDGSLPGLVITGSDNTDDDNDHDHDDNDNHDDENYSKIKLLAELCKS